MRKWCYAAFAVLVACGGSSSDAGPSGSSSDAGPNGSDSDAGPNGSDSDASPPDDSPEGVCAYWAEKECAAEENCDPSFEGFWNDRPTCVERTKLGCFSDLNAPDVKDTPSRFAVCANAVAGLSCDKFIDYEHWPVACTPPPGQLADGAPCIVRGQCQGGACNIRSASACGVCKTVSDIGGACASDTDCRDALLCMNGVCTAHPRAGEACDMAGLQCYAGSVCKNVDAAGNGTCGTPTPAGGACDPMADECDAWRGFMCDSRSRTCKQATVDVPIGAPCLATGCNASGYCGPDGTCKPIPREGEPCAPVTAECMYPAHCINGVCKIRDAAVCK